MVKTALRRYMVRSDINSADYIEVKDSLSLKQFGDRYLSVPGSHSQLDGRVFIDLLPQDILARKAEVDDSTTYAGIRSKFQYICKVRHRPRVTDVHK